MSKLFKNKLIKETLQTFEVSELEEKIQVLAKWTKALMDNSLHSKTESQCEQAFNQDVFTIFLDNLVGCPPYHYSSYSSSHSI